MSDAKMYKRWQFWVILWLAVTAVNLYRRDTKPLVSGGNPPIIEFEGGRGHLQLYVTGPYTLEELKQEYKPGDKYHSLWQLDPGSFSGGLGGSITYGIVPGGFRQVYPANGKPPEPLIEGKIYSVTLPNSNCGGPNVESEYFMIENGKVVIAPPGKITEK